MSTILLSDQSTEEEAFAAAFYRASRLRYGSIPPLWEHVDPVIRRAFIGAARGYFAGGPLVEPVLRMEPRYDADGHRLTDECVEEPVR